MPEQTAVDTLADAPIYLESFDRQKAVIRAVPTDDLETINVDPLFAIQATQRALPRLRLMRSRLIEEITKFDVTSLDNLQDYSHAYAYATMLLRAAEPQVSGFDALVQECSETLGKMEAYLRAAVEAGILNGAALNELKGGLGHRNTVHDLLLVAQVYRTNWAKIEGKTFFTQADVRRADALAARLNASIAERESKPSGIDEVNLDRQRAYTLFYRAYSRVRRAVEFVLKEDGEYHLLEEVMPSLHNNRVGRKRGRDAEPETEPTVPAGPGASGAAPVTSPQPASGGKVGMPDSDPFTS